MTALASPLQRRHVAAKRCGGCGTRIVVSPGVPAPGEARRVEWSCKHQCIRGAAVEYARPIRSAPFHEVGR